MEKRIFEIGGKEFEIKVNFRLSYNLTKYRNRVTAGFDFEDSDKEVVDEIMKLQQRVANGEEVSYSDMSSGAIEFLMKNSKSNSNLFSGSRFFALFNKSCQSTYPFSGVYEIAVSNVVFTTLLRLSGAFDIRLYIIGSTTSLILVSIL